MKKCPKCNRNIPSDANICPYCGVPQPGYNPTKRKVNNKKSMYLYYIVLIVLIIMPMILSYMFAYNTLTNDTSSSKKITLSSYTESSKESVRYQYQSLSDFSNKVTNSQPYVTKIKGIEKKLNKLIPNDEFVKNYSFQITQNNNVYAFVDYELTAKTNDVYHIEYSYNLSGESQCRVTTSQKNIKTIDDVNQLLVDQQKQLNEVIQLFNGKDNTKLLKNTQDDFIAMKDSLLNETISHYGKGVSKSSSTQSYAIRIFSSKDTYRLKTTFETQLKMKNFM